MATRRDSRRTGLWPLAYMGVEPISPPLLITDNRAPTENDYANFNVGTIWIDRSTAPSEDIWMLVNKDANVARWIQFDMSVIGDVLTLTGNIGGAVGSDGVGNIDVVGSSQYIFTGNPGTNTLTLSDDGTIATQYDTNLGSAVPNAGVLQVLGGELIGTTGAANVVTANLDRGTDGQLIIAASGASSAYADLTSVDGSIIITTGANSIDLSASISASGYSNLGMTVDTGASTITIHSLSGAALSVSNPAYISFASKATPGTFVTIVVTANVSIDWSDMDGNTMGTDAAKAWANDMPLYLYAVLNDAENDCTFGFGRAPHYVASGLAARIGTPVSATADNLLSLFLFENVTIGDYDDNPALVLGSVTATKNGADQWSFSAISGGTTGIGGLQVAVRFLMPATQMSADNNYAYASGGVVPTFTTSDCNYAVTPDGFLTISFALNAVSIVGVGTDIFSLVLPLSMESGVTDAGIFCVGDAGVSVAAVRGVYRAIPVAGPTGNVLAFIKNEIRRLQVGDFDTVNIIGSNISGSTSFLISTNRLP